MPIQIALLPLDARLAGALAVGNLAALYGRATNASDIADDGQVWRWCFMHTAVPT